MTKVYSANAQSELKDKIASIKQSLKLVETEMQKYESLQMVHYGHVGDLTHIDNLLIETLEFISEAD